MIACGIIIDKNAVSILQTTRDERNKDIQQPKSEREQ
jgi:hypothetical protein